MQLLTPMLEDTWMWSRNNHQLNELNTNKLLITTNREGGYLATGMIGVGGRSATACCCAAAVRRRSRRLRYELQTHNDDDNLGRRNGDVARNVTSHTGHTHRYALRLSHTVVRGRRVAGKRNQGRRGAQGTHVTRYKK